MFNSVIAYSIIGIQEIEDNGPNFKAAVQNHRDIQTDRVVIASQEFVEDMVVELAKLRNENETLRGLQWPRDSGDGYNILWNSPRLWVFWYHKSLCWRWPSLLSGKDAKLRGMRRLMLDLGRLRITIPRDKHRFWEPHNAIPRRKKEG